MTPVLPLSYVPEDMLGYQRSRYRFASGERLQFDEPYRYAHLPLLNADHPLAINDPDGFDYHQGRYEKTRYSLVIPVQQSVLANSVAFQAIDGALRRSSFGQKIDFALCKKRQTVQHITIAGGFRAEDLDRVEATLHHHIAHSGSLACRLKGPFVGAKNFGRLYFPAFPALTSNGDAYGALQNALGLKTSGFYGLGFYNFAEELTVPETAELQTILDQATSQTVADLNPDELWLMATNDDLALSAKVLTRIKICHG